MKAIIQLDFYNKEQCVTQSALIMALLQQHGLNSKIKAFKDYSITADGQDITVQSQQTIICNPFRQEQFFAVAYYDKTKARQTLSCAQTTDSSHKYVSLTDVRDIACVLTIKDNQLTITDEPLLYRAVRFHQPKSRNGEIDYKAYYDWQKRQINTAAIFSATDRIGLCFFNQKRGPLTTVVAGYGKKLDVSKEKGITIIPKVGEFDVEQYVDALRAEPEECMTRYLRCCFLIEAVIQAVRGFHICSGQVHNDLKPEHLRITVLNKYPHFKVHIIDPEYAQPTKTSGTPGYIPFIKCIDSNFTVAQDVFAFGIIVLTIFSGCDTLHFTKQHYALNEASNHDFKQYFEALANGSNWPKGFNKAFPDQEICVANKQALLPCFKLNTMKPFSINDFYTSFMSANSVHYNNREKYTRALPAINVTRVDEPTSLAK